MSNVKMQFTIFPPLQQQQRDIMERFNFERVLNAMHALNWTWMGKKVTIEMLQSNAMELMDNVQRQRVKGWKSVSTGGFEARIDEVCGQDRMSLSFCVESIDAPQDYSSNGENNC